MSHFGWSVIASGILAAWLRTELGVVFESLTEWFLRCRQNRHCAKNIRAMRSPTLRFLMAAALPMVLPIVVAPFLLGLLLVQIARVCGVFHLLLLVGSLTGSVVCTTILVVDVMDRMFSTTIAVSYFAWGDAFLHVIAFLIGPPTLYAIWRDEQKSVSRNNELKVLASP
jgi:hypothetical protein